MPTDGPALRVRIGPVRGWQQLELDEERQQARVPPGTLVDLGATAKGLAVDLCAQAAAAAGDCGVLVSLGGDMAVGGAAPRGGWPVTVTDLSDLSRPAHEGLAQVIGLSRGGLATSSTRARRWRRGGSELHHLIDPGSGVPVASPWRTVSVTAETCVLANTGSTAAIVLGDSAQRWLTERGLTARLVRRDGTVSYGVLRRQLAGAAARGRGAAPRGAMRLEWA